MNKDIYTNNIKIKTLVTKEALAKLTNESGQTLLFVVVAMTIALSIGINASVKTLTSLSRTSRTDTASRALAAAEGGIERYLALSPNQLEEAVSGSCPQGDYQYQGGYDNGPACRIEFDDISDILVSQAYVSVERYTPTFYPFTLESGQVKEVNLYDDNTDTFYSDNHIEICWNSNPDSDIMYISYNSSGIQERGGLEGNDSPGAPYTTEGFTTAGGGHDGYNNCETVDIGNNIYGLRIRSIGGESDVAVFPTPGNILPLQGYKIISIGKLEQDQAVTATRVIRIIKTLPYLPVSFDYALYSQGGVSK